MPEGDWEVTFIFDMPGHGFTETHWRRSTAEETLEQFFAVAQELGRRRQGMSGEQTILQGVRISNAQQDGRVGTTQLNSVLGTTGKGSAASNVAMNILCADAGNLHTKTTQFRGFWDDEEVTGGAVLRSQPFITAFNSWQQYYVANDFGWYGVATTTQYPIIGYTVTDAGMVLLQVSNVGQPSLPLNKPKSISISGLNAGRSQLNGEKVVILLGPDTGPNTWKVALKFPQAAIPFSQIGFLNVKSYTFRNAAAASIQRMGKRQAGAPLLRSRGRSPKRIRV